MNPNSGGKVREMQQKANEKFISNHLHESQNHSEDPLVFND